YRICRWWAAVPLQADHRCDRFAVVDARSTVGLGMMSSFTYVQDLPEAIGATITRAVELYAAKNGLQAEVWFHGLPIWIVREMATRANKVQIEAIQYDGRAFVSFTPD